MRKEIIIRMQPDPDKGGNKALKVAASVSGVESVTVTGSGKDLLLVIGDGVDEGKLTKKLKKEVGDAEIVELRTLPSSTSTRTTNAPPSTSYYYHRTPSPGYYQQYGEPSAMAAGQGGYGYGYGYVGGSGGGGMYAREVARSHPVNFSPMIARHDLRAVVGREAQRAAGGEGRREHGGGGGPNCCSIL